MISPAPSFHSLALALVTVCATSYYDWQLTVDAKQEVAADSLLVLGRGMKHLNSNYFATFANCLFN